MINSKIWIIIERCFEIEITYNVIDRRLTYYYNYRLYLCVVDKRDKDETKKINVVNNNY